MKILVLNCGSSTIKYKVFSVDKNINEELSGVVETDDGYRQAVDNIMEILPSKPDAVAHRVVHGGNIYTKPTIIDKKMFNDLEKLSELAPLHNPPALEGISAFLDAQIPQVAVFDTAFHQTIPEFAYKYAIPNEIAEKFGIRRYGFHGMSHQFVMQQYAMLETKKAPDIITLHLGNGASVAAIKSGKCIDTSMGITPLEGLIMGTRAGDIDPGIVVKLLKNGINLEEIEKMLWHESGLKGICGQSDMRIINEQTDANSKLAIEMFCYRIKKYIGSYLAAIGNAQALVFTGGIGENSPEIREKSISGLESLGLILDATKNKNNETLISDKNSKLKIFRIPTNEELLIANEANKLLNS